MEHMGVGAKRGKDEKGYKIGRRVERRKADEAKRKERGGFGETRCEATRPGSLSGRLRGIRAMEKAKGARARSTLRCCR